MGSEADFANDVSWLGDDGSLGERLLCGYTGFAHELPDLPPVK